MNNPRLAGRYAKSLIDLAIELNQVDAVYADMKLLQKICKSNPDFTAVLRSPVINSGIKGKVINAILDQKVGVTTNTFINLLLRKGREPNLPEIAETFITQFNKLRNIYRLKLTTAAPVSDEIKDAIVQKVKSTTPYKNIELETAVKQELIGGFLLEIEGNLIDASILRDLKDIKKQFMNNQYVHKIR